MSDDLDLDRRATPDDVERFFRLLLNRPVGNDEYKKKIDQSGISVGALARNILASGEFSRRFASTKDTAAASPPGGPAMTGKRIDAPLLRVPNELSVTDLSPRRVLIVGSCLSEKWAYLMKRLPEPCDTDIYLMGNDLPETPARPIDQYEFQIVQIPLRPVIPDGTFARLAHADELGHEKLFNHAVNRMRQFLAGALRWSRQHGILTFVFPFVVPAQNAVGRLLPRYHLSNPVYFVERLNQEMANEIAAVPNSYMFDLNEIFSFYGRRYVQEDWFTAFNHGSLMSDFDHQHDGNRLETALRATDLFEERIAATFQACWRELVAMYRTIKQVDMVKLVVIDLDDTLWRGVIADLEKDDLPSSEGWPKALWEALLFLKRRGVLLAIISKNEELRVREFWDGIVGRQLSLDDFAMRRINWRPKAENMADILATVNLLPRNVVYIDDNPAERAAIKSAFPDIRVLGGTPLTWRRILLWAAETQVPSITAESAARTDMVRAQVTREEHRQTMSREEFLASLQVRMTLFQVTDDTHPRFPRVLELINKTNQFNTTGRRWSREECVAGFKSELSFYAFEVADLYTEYGLVGVVIADDTGIRQFVMSCRIMGLEAEVAAVAQIGAFLRDTGTDTMFAAMIETERNQPCRDLYARCGFEAVEGGWRRGLDDSWLAVPAHIDLTVQRMPVLVAAE